MKTAKKIKGTAVSMPVGIAVGAFISIVITGGLAALLTWLVLNGKINEASVGYLAMGILVIASILGAILAASKIKRRWMFVCCLTGTAYYLVLLACTAVFFGGNFRGLGVTALVVLAGSLIAGILGLKKERGRDRSIKKYRTC